MIRKETYPVLIILMLLFTSLPSQFPVMAEASWSPEVKDQPIKTIKTATFPLEADVPKVLNWTKFWQKFRQHAKWKLEGDRGQGWEDAGDYLSIIKNHTAPSVYKITLIFDAPVTANYRLTFGIDKHAKEYFHREGSWNYTLAYRDYAIIFDWSDVKEIPNLIISHGVKKVSGEKWFWFRIRRDNVPKNVHVEIDPTITYANWTLTGFLERFAPFYPPTSDPYLEQIWQTCCVGRRHGCSETNYTTSRPDGNGYYTAWDGDYTDVDEVSPDNDTTVISTSTYLNKESFTFQNISEITIEKVLVFARSKRNSTVAYLTGFLRIDSVDYVHTDNDSIYDYWHNFHYTWDKNPSTGVDWTVEDINNLEAGVRYNGGTGQINTTQVYLQVYPRYYGLARSYLSFNTTSLPEEATLLGATLSLMLRHDVSEQDFGILLHTGSGEWTTTEECEWDDCSQSLGSLLSTTAGIEVGEWYSKSIPVSHVNTSGTTQFRLTSSREEESWAGVVWGGNEYIYFWNDFTGEYGPKLVVVYAVDTTLLVTFFASKEAPTLNEPVDVSWTIYVDGVELTDFSINITRDEFLWLENYGTSSTPDVEDLETTHVYSASGVIDNTYGLTDFKATPVVVEWSKTGAPSGDGGNGGNGGGIIQPPVVIPSLPPLVMYGSIALLGIVGVSALVHEARRHKDLWETTKHNPQHRERKKRDLRESFDSVEKKRRRRP